MPTVTTLLNGDIREFYKGEEVEDHTSEWWWADDDDLLGKIVWSNTQWFLPNDKGEASPEECMSALRSLRAGFGTRNHEGREVVGERVAFRYCDYASPGCLFRWLVFNAAKRVTRRLTDDERDKAKESASHWFLRLQSRIAILYLDYDHLMLTNWSGPQIQEAHRWFDADEQGLAGQMPPHLAEVVKSLELTDRAEALSTRAKKLRSICDRTALALGGFTGNESGGSSDDFLEHLPEEARLTQERMLKAEALVAAEAKARNTPVPPQVEPFEVCILHLDREQHGVLIYDVRNELNAEHAQHEHMRFIVVSDGVHANCYYLMFRTADLLEADRFRKIASARYNALYEAAKRPLGTQPGPP